MSTPAIEAEISRRAEWARVQALIDAEWTPAERAEFDRLYSEFTTGGVAVLGPRADAARAAADRLRAEVTRRADALDRYETARRRAGL